MTRTASPATPVTAPAAPSEPGIPLGGAALVYFGLSLLFFLPAFLPGRQMYGTDYLAGSYIFYQFISERLAAGELPGWVPYVYGGLPLFANPGSTYHPVFLLASWLLPVHKAFAAVFVVHFWIAGTGMYLLARELECRRWVAFVAGIAFQFTGIVASWVYAGHDGRVMVATLTPLVFFFFHRGVRTGVLAPFVGAATAIGFALLSFQIQNSYYLLVAGAVWAMFCLFHLGATSDPRRLIRTLALGLGAVGFAFFLASVNFLPFLDYIPESPRGQGEGRGYVYATSYSMPEAELLSLAVPEQAGVSVADPVTGRPLFPAYRGENGFKLHTEYVGALVIVLLALGVRYTRRDRRWVFFGALALFFLAVALGGNTPLYRVFYEVLPGTKRFRAPSLSFFVVAFALVSMAALTLERLARLRDAAQEGRRGSREPDGGAGAVGWIAAGIVTVATLGAALSAGGESVPGAPTVAQGWIRFALFAAAVGGVLWAWTGGRLTAGVAAVSLATITLADLWVIDKRFFHTVEAPEVIFAPDDVISFLLAQPQPARMWAFPFPEAYRGGRDYPMLFDIDMAAGEHGNQLQRWNEYLGAGTETFVDWHNFVAEAGVADTPAGQAIAFRSTPGFLDAANVRYVVSTAPLANPALREVYRGSALVYENTEALPRAYLVPEVVPVPLGGALPRMQRGWDPSETAFVAGDGPALPDGPLRGAAEVTAYSPDRVSVRAQASRPALLVLADNDYPGWEVTVNGREAEALRVNHTFRGVVVPAGASEVVWTFRPTALRTGFYLTLTGFALLAGYGVWLLFRVRGRAARTAAG